MRFIGKYIVRGLLGRGGMASVYKVKIPRLGRLAALKLLDPRPELAALLGAESLRKRFISEAQAMASLHHPNLPMVWDLDEADGRLFYLMDYYCRDLARLIGEGPRLEDPARRLTPERALNLTRQCVQGLDRLHQAGMAHRDIKPGNLLLTTEDQVKICDFGLAKLPGLNYREPPNLLVGSPYYTAPEQEKDPQAADRRSDLYSAGMVLLRLLSGRLDLDPDAWAAQLPQPELARSTGLFFQRALAPEPQKRFQSAARMLSALDELMELWLTARQAVCAGPEPELPRPTPLTPGQRRSRSIKTGVGQARAEFGLDSLWRPQSYNPGPFRILGDDLVEDPGRGLLWERSGSSYPLTWGQALRRVYELNQNGFGGRRDWRVPTIDELISLMQTPEDSAVLCRDYPFDPKQDWLWSADRHSFTSAWLASLSEGFVGWQDNSCLFHLRAVTNTLPA